MPRTAYLWQVEFQSRGSLWKHSGRAEDPHPILTGEKHSDSYTNSSLVTVDHLLLMEIANDIARRVIEKGLSILDIDRVVGPQTGATDLARALSHLLTFVRGSMGVCGWASPKKIGEGARKKIVFDESDTKNYVKPGESVLVCEDVYTSRHTLDLTIQAVRDKGGKPMPFSVALVNQSGTEGGLLSLFRRSIKIWPAAECPLCSMGSEALRPKDNWASFAPHQ